MAAVIDVSIPKGWAELSQQQLRFLLATMVRVNRDNKNVGFRSREDYAAQSAAQVRTLCFLEWSGLKVICRYGNGWLVKSDKTEFELSAEVLTDAASHLSWTKDVPPSPVRLEVVDGAHAIPADISSGLSFDSWLACETLWQRYQAGPDDALLRQMAEILYNKENIKMDAAESLGIFYWWAAVKDMVSNLFPNFFKKVDADGEPQPLLYDEMRRNMDAQIRALTKGDVTKEHEILALDALRALTELDAQAREYDEIRKKYPTT